MTCSVVHHIEVCVKNDKIIHLLTAGFGFTPFAYRITHAASKLALRNGSIIFIAVKRRCQMDDGSQDDTIDTDKGEVNGDCSNSSINIADEFKDGNEDWTVFCCENSSKHKIDSVFNVALVVNDVDAVTNRSRSLGGQVLKEPLNMRDGLGHVRYSMINSCCGNIVHTLIDKKEYSGSFLPGFKMIENHNKKCRIFNHVLKEFVCTGSDEQYINTQGTANIQSTWSITGNANQMNGEHRDLPITTHIDHVTFACEAGKSADILSWYESCFGMKRFKINREENEKEGFVLAENIGLRLKVMEYWKCAETGLVSPSNNINDSSLKIVIAEPLPEVNTNHIDKFLQAHGGPGVEHIGLHTPAMVHTVEFMARNGVTFRKAPPAYYQKGIKLDEIKEAGHASEIELFKELGILLDTEADAFSDSEDKKRYLMQVFTTPIFSENTFFLEVLQRCGARGFGGGNIKALAKSIVLYNEQLKTEEEK